MKPKLLCLLCLIAWTSCAFAEDVDIYGISNIDLKPNVLIILDNSGSMGTEDVPSDPYSPPYTGDYTGDAVYAQEDVYQEVCGWKWSKKKRRNVYVCHSEKIGVTWNLYFDDINSSNWQCNSAKEDLLSDGHWYGKLYKSGAFVNCSGSGSNTDYALGNYLNFLATGGAEGEDRSRMEVAKEVVANLIYNNIENVNFGLMAFNEDSAYPYYNYANSYSDYYGNGGYIVAQCGSSLNTLIGDFDPETDAMADSDQSNYGAVGLLKSDTNTPLAETLAEAGLYFAGKQSWFNSAKTGYPLGHYNHSCTDENTSCQDYNNDSPIEYRCQKNYIILVTDGEPTQDDDKFADFNYILDENLTESTSDGNSSYLDDVAEFLQNTDVRSGLGETGDFEDQTITTYTIGFTEEVDATLLTSTANRGGGDYSQTSSAAQLSQALNNIIINISEQNEVFTAAAVPVSRANKAYAGNFVYYGLFQPTNSGNWYGNLKKYAITDDGVIQDKNGNAIESGGTVVNNAVSFWNNTMDGPSVTAGGAGEVLRDRTTERNIYTYTGTTSTLTDTNNLFVTTNTALTDGTYTDLTTTVIDAVRNGVSNDWPLGSLLHSQPVVVHYDTESMIYAGANDGMLHCFDDDDGEEMWGFIPQDLLGDLNLLNSPTSLKYFVDGTPVYYHYDDDNNDDTADKKLLIFGERRGGIHYTALDISNYNAPIFKYSISPDILGSNQEQLGQSWAEPLALEMGYTLSSTYNTKDVLLMAGGYDINQDALPTDTDPPEATDATGRAVYAVDAQTGALFSNFLFSHDNYSAMTHSIIAVSGFENPKSTTTTRVYAGDMNGNMFAFRDDIFHRNTVSSLADNFDGLYDGQEDGSWAQKLKLYSIPGRKIWYAPNIVNEYFLVDFTYPAGEISETEDVVVSEKRVGDYVFFGTGDRAHPERTDLLNKFYAIKNNWQWYSESPTIVEAYIDINDAGKVKTKNADGYSVTIVDWDEDTVDTGLYILDVTYDLIQNNETDADLSQKITAYVKNAINHKNNRGWFIRLEEEDGSQVGEKIASSPLIYDGVVYFSTYVPGDEEKDDSDDPCAVSGAGGNGYLYALGYEYGGAAINFDDDDDDDDDDGEEVLERQDRRKKLKSKGIPSQPVLVIHEGKPTIITGFETTDPVTPAGLERAFWRQLNN
nr:PilC/PilY family type IV pilus protein [uncultured Desulfobacter sp.]